MATNDITEVDDKPQITEAEKKELYRQLAEKQKEISELRKNLNSINDQKEAAFEQREKYSKEISQHIYRLRDSKQKRDTLTVNVKEAKKNRNELNKKIKEKNNEINKLRKEKEELQRKHNIRGDPSQIRRDIRRLEYKIETEVMSFDKEKQLMKTIKGLKKKLAECAVIEAVSKKIDEAYREIKRERDETDSLHKRVVTTAATSQQKHEIILGESKEIDELRSKEKEANDKFMELKKAFKEVNDQLKARLEEINLINKKLGNAREHDKIERERREDEILKSKEELVQEKLKKGEKLTTDDLLVMQGIMMKEEKELMRRKAA